MGFGTNPAFRSRSLVRSRIGAFRASDAGSNPAGSMLFYNTPQHSLHVRKCFRLSVDRLRVTTYSPGVPSTARFLKRPGFTYLFAPSLGPNRWRPELLERQPHSRCHGEGPSGRSSGPSEGDRQARWSRRHKSDRQLDHGQEDGGWVGRHQLLPRGARDVTWPAQPKLTCAHSRSKDYWAYRGPGELRGPFNEGRSFRPLAGY